MNITENKITRICEKLFKKTTHKKLETGEDKKISESKKETVGTDIQFYGAHSLDEEYMRLYTEGLEASKMPGHSWRTPRFFQMTQMFIATRGIKGATLEAGCFRGLASHIICRYLQVENGDFKGAGHFMVDSFEGLSEPVDKDGDFSKKRFSDGAFTKTSLEHCQQTMADFPETKIIQGWIPEAFSELPEQAYRFVHIDVDVYEPTLDSLRYFYPKLSPGGIIVIDDFGPWPEGKWPGCKLAVEEFSAEAGVPFARLDTGNAVFIKRA